MKNFWYKARVEWEGSYMQEPGFRIGTHLYFVESEQEGLAFMQLGDNSVYYLKEDDVEELPSNQWSDQEILKCIECAIWNKAGPGRIFMLESMLKDGFFKKAKDGKYQPVDGKARFSFELVAIFAKPRSLNQLKDFVEAHTPFTFNRDVVLIDNKGFSQTLSVVKSKTIKVSKYIGVKVHSDLVPDFDDGVYFEVTDEEIDGRTVYREVV